MTSYSTRQCAGKGPDLGAGVRIWFKEEMEESFGLEHPPYGTDYVIHLTVRGKPKHISTL